MMCAAEIRNLFDRNATTYDWVNTVISLGLDAKWRNWVAGQASRKPGANVLDACSGTGPVGIQAALRGANVTLADISPKMLSIAEEKTRSLGVYVTTKIADLTHAELAFERASFDVITLSFGLRYIENRREFISSLASLLKPDGRFIILEFVSPARRPIPLAAAFYFYHVLPILGSLLARRRELYNYLVSSVARIGRATELQHLIKDAGLEILEARSFGFGLVHGVVAMQGQSS